MVRAAVYTERGPAREVLRVVELPDPEPGPGQVRVRVKLSGVNPTDVKSRSGLTPGPLAVGGTIPHHDAVGVIDAVGTGVPAERIGERVWTYLAAVAGHGTAAEYVCLPTEQAVALPEPAPDELGPCLGVPALTAYQALHMDGPIEGQTVLVAGGAGAVGHFAIQLAKRAGAQVITTISTPAKAEQAIAAGADLAVFYREHDAAGVIRDAVPTGVDRIIEVSLGTNLELDLAVLAPHGTIVTYAADAITPQLPVRPLMTLNANLRFLLLYGVPGLDRVAAQVSAAAADLTPLPLLRFPLDEIAAAHEAVETGVAGKVVIELG
jgi:NADPH2:quinone reductase